MDCIELEAKYDKDADAAYIYLDDKAKIVKTLELNRDVIIDLDCHERIVGIEILKARSKPL